MSHTLSQHHATVQSNVRVLITGWEEDGKEMEGQSEGREGEEGGVMGGGQIDKGWECDKEM